MTEPRPTAATERASAEESSAKALTFIGRALRQ